MFFSVIGIFAGTYSSNSSALADAEANAGQALNNNRYGTLSLGNDIPTNILINSYADEEVAGYLSTPDSSHSDADPEHGDAETYTGSHAAFHASTNPHGFDDPLIPEAVWSFDTSTGAHLDNISVGPGWSVRPGLDPNATIGSPAEVNYFWLREISSPWIYQSTSNASSLLRTPIIFQVASCGGTSAEHSNLDYCSNINITPDQLNDYSDNYGQNNSIAETQSASNNVLSSNSAPAYSTGQATTHPLPPVIADRPVPPVIADRPAPQETLTVISPCDISASCAGVVIDRPDTPVDLPPDGGDSGSGTSLPPVFTPDPLPLPDAPLSSQTPPTDPPAFDPPPLTVDQTQPPEPVTTPEASTWVMTIVGFSFMAFAFRKRRRPRLNPISIIDISEET
jgi:hypothetical protein